jgi:hypothetical protein
VMDLAPAARMTALRGWGVGRLLGIGFLSGKIVFSRII